MAMLARPFELRTSRYDPDGEEGLLSKPFAKGNVGGGSGVLPLPNPPEVERLRIDGLGDSG